MNKDLYDSEYINIETIHKAIIFACKKHEAQYRKSTDIPYISHIMEVYGFLRMMNSDWQTCCAGILHDTLEDTSTTKQELVNEFGEQVAELVANESEDKSKSWKERKQTTINRLKTATLQIKEICCADKLSNLLSIFYDQQKIGEKVWERFNADKEHIHWYYAEIIRALDLNTQIPFLMLKYYYKKVFFEYSASNK